MKAPKKTAVDYYFLVVGQLISCVSIAMVALVFALINLYWEGTFSLVDGDWTALGGASLFMMAFTASEQMKKLGAGKKPAPLDIYGVLLVGIWWFFFPPKKYKQMKQTERARAAEILIDGCPFDADTDTILDLLKQVVVLLRTLCASTQRTCVFLRRAELALEKKLSELDGEKGHLCGIIDSLESIDLRCEPGEIEQARKVCALEYVLEKMHDEIDSIKDSEEIKKRDLGLVRMLIDLIKKTGSSETLSNMRIVIHDENG